MVLENICVCSKYKRPKREFGRETMATSRRVGSLERLPSDWLFPSFSTNTSSKNIHTQYLYVCQAIPKGIYYTHTHRILCEKKKIRILVVPISFFLYMWRLLSFFRGTFWLVGVSRKKRAESHLEDFLPLYR